MALHLTYDDGPDPEWTPELLDLLAAAGARATFFPIAERVALDPDLVARMRAEGHAVGIHCHLHVRHSSRDAGWGARDAARSLETLRATGVEPALWRTPWGDRAPWTAPLAERLALRLVGWDVDTHDWRGDAAEAMFAATEADLVPGAVVLAHDGIGPGALRADARETVGYTERVIAHAGAAGLTLEALA